jgi:hypothetical protein
MANKGFSSFNANFSRASVGNDNSPTIWTYNSTDTLQQSGNNNVTSTGYFNAVANKLKVGDFIFASGAASPNKAGLVIVRSNTRSVTPTFVAGVVNVSLATLFSIAKSSSGT